MAVPSCSISLPITAADFPADSAAECSAAAAADSPAVDRGSLAAWDMAAHSLAACCGPASARTRHPV